MTRRLNLLKIEDGLVYYTNEDNDCVLKERPHELVTRGVVRLFDCKQDRDSIYAMTSMTKLYPSNLKVLGSARMTWFEGEATI
jgi:hypothetical protein